MDDPIAKINQIFADHNADDTLKGILGPHLATLIGLDDDLKRRSVLLIMDVPIIYYQRFIRIHNGGNEARLIKAIKIMVAGIEKVANFSNPQEIQAAYIEHLWKECGFLSEEIMKREFPELTQ